MVKTGFWLERVTAKVGFTVVCTVSISTEYAVRTYIGILIKPNYSNIIQIRAPLFNIRTFELFK